MLRNHLTIALRTFGKQKGITAINVFGLATGMAVCLLVGLPRAPSERSYLLMGKSTTEMSKHRRTEIHRSQVGVVFQTYHLIDGQVARDQRLGETANP